MAAMFAACSTVEYDTFATLTGTVVDAEDQSPIGGVSVTLTPSGKSTYTGNDGYFQFQDLEAQTYTILVQKSGYTTNRKAVATAPGETENVVVTMQKN